MEIKDEIHKILSETYLLSKYGNGTFKRDIIEKALESGRMKINDGVKWGDSISRESYYEEMIYILERAKKQIELLYDRKDEIHIKNGISLNDMSYPFRMLGIMWLNGLYTYRQVDEDIEFFKLLQLKNSLQELKENIEKTAPYPQPSKGDFPRLRTQKPSLNINQLEALYSQLKENGYIAQDTGKELFVWLFGGKVEPQPFKPIKWEKNKTLLVYLIDNLCYDSTYSFNLWKNAEEIFSVKSMAVVKQNYFGNKKTVGKPVGYEEIDSIIDIMRGV